jgi:predicted amidohydrolase
MSREIVVATVQMRPVLNEVEENLVKIADFIRKVATEQKVDLIVFPELITTGYECGMYFTDLAQRIPGPAVNVLAQRAADYGVHVLFGMAAKERVESILFNTAVLIGPDGEVLGDYRKVHLRGEERLAFRGGYKPVVFESELGPIGVMLGWDLAFPEMARTLVMDGAELLVVAAAWEEARAEEWRTLVLARAYENACYVAAANRVGEDVTYTFCGDSLIVGPRGQLLASLVGDRDEETGKPIEGYCVAKLDLEEVRRAREDSQILQSRQPLVYRSLVRKY